MPLPAGRTIALSRGRRFVADIVHFSRSVPLVGVSTVVRMPQTAAAREAADPKPGWYPILLKAFALGAARVPEVRRSLLTFPYTRLYQHACSVATVTIERDVDGEPTVLVFQVRQPDAMRLADIDAKFRRVKSAPLAEVAEFRRFARLMRLPRPLRRLAWWVGIRASGSCRQKYFGTFGSSSLVSAGANVIGGLCPLTSFFTFDPVAADGSIRLRLEFDHRVFDGMTAARALQETATALRTEILDELRTLARPARAAG